MSATVVAERAQKNEDSRVNVRAAVRWMQLLEALKGLWNRGFSEGICIQREGYCMCRLHVPKRAIWRARGPLYIEEIRALERRAPAEAADGLEAYRMKEALVA